MSAPSPVPESLLREIVATYAPRRVILFGSRARGDARPDSDMDLLLEMDDDAPREAMARSIRHAEGPGFSGDVEIHPWRVSDLRRREHLRGAFAATIRREGVTVYENPARCEEPAVPEGERVTAAEETRTWVDRAQRDRRAATIMMDLNPPDVDIAAFHIQRAAEKLVKALLILADREVPKSHNLRDLDARLGADSPIPRDLAAELARFSDWVISGRYPDPPRGDYAPTEPRVRAALEHIARLEAIVAAALDRAG
ncbi:MAG: HEPN domain-containing protein [Acetobacteraceae bacterium]|nr:HEPN domain-containing protein [Acetobacteraceae bacterium]